jgi:hypothetical protein
MDAIRASLTDQDIAAVKGIAEISAEALISATACRHRAMGAVGPSKNHRSTSVPRRRVGARMRHFVEGTDRVQSTLFPECLEDWISEDNPVRVIDVFVDELDLAELGFDGVKPEMTGRPSYHPSVLLKLYIYVYLTNLILFGISAGPKPRAFRARSGSRCGSRCSTIRALHGHRAASRTFWAIKRA